MVALSLLPAPMVLGPSAKVITRRTGQTLISILDPTACPSFLFIGTQDDETYLSEHFIRTVFVLGKSFTHGLSGQGLGQVLEEAVPFVQFQVERLVDSGAAAVSASHAAKVGSRTVFIVIRGAELGETGPEALRHGFVVKGLQGHISKVDIGLED
jgi:hypothetical protein